MNKNFDENKLGSLLRLLNTFKHSNSKESYPFIINILNSMYIPLPNRQIPAGKQLIRSRVHEENNLFNEISDLSYRTDLNNIQSFGRANEPGQSMFYCANDEGLSIGESSKLVRENLFDEDEIITTGFWTLEKDLRVVNILSNDKIVGLNSEVDIMSKDFDLAIENVATASAKILQKFLRYLSIEFTTKSTESNSYIITSAFANYIFNNFPEIDGIMYPSTIYLKDGLNLVLKPTSVDSKMKFKGAVKRQFIKNELVNYTEDKKNTLHSENHNGNDGKIKWRTKF